MEGGGGGLNNKNFRRFSNRLLPTFFFRLRKFFLKETKLNVGLYLYNFQREKKREAVSRFRENFEGLRPTFSKVIIQLKKYF